MNTTKITLAIFVLFSTPIKAYDDLQEAILNSDYETVIQNYNPRETPVNAQHAYWALADDTY